MNGFTEDSSPEMMYVYQRGEDEPFHAQVKNIGIEKGLYTDELESILANDIESSANPILLKLRNLSQ